MVERYKKVVEGTGKEALLVVHVGVNDVGRVRSEELMLGYRELLREIRESGRRCIVSGVFPLHGVRGWWLSHALGLNERLMRMCGGGWGRFYG